MVGNRNVANTIGLVDPKDTEDIRVHSAYQGHRAQHSKYTEDIRDIVHTKDIGHSTPGIQRISGTWCIPRT